MAERIRNGILYPLSCFGGEVQNKGGASFNGISGIGEKLQQDKAVCRLVVNGATMGISDIAPSEIGNKNAGNL